jgi:hypothetical protein
MSSIVSFPILDKQTLDFIAKTSTQKQLLGAVTSDVTNKKVTIETVLDSVFKYGGQLVDILSKGGVFRNKNLQYLNEIAQRGYNQNDVERLKDDIDLGAFGSLLNTARSSSDIPKSEEKDNTLLYLGLGALGLGALYLIINSNKEQQQVPTEIKKR